MGDELLGTNNRWTPIDAINFTTDERPVYNIHVSNDHTYFVGNATWGFSVWVHNSYPDANGVRHRNNGQFAAKPGPKPRKPNRIHGNDLRTKRPAQGYSLRDKKTGKVVKYGETIHGRARYTEKYLDSINARMFFEAGGSKLKMHRWQTKKILDHIKEFGERPKYNLTNY